MVCCIMHRLPYLFSNSLTSFPTKTGITGSTHNPFRHLFRAGGRAYVICLVLAVFRWLRCEGDDRSRRSFDISFRCGEVGKNHQPGDECATIRMKFMLVARGASCETSSSSIRSQIAGVQQSIDQTLRGPIRTRIADCLDKATNARPTGL